MAKSDFVVSHYYAEMQNNQKELSNGIEINYKMIQGMGIPCQLLNMLKNFSLVINYYL